MNPTPTPPAFIAESSAGLSLALADLPGCDQVIGDPELIWLAPGELSRTPDINE